MGFLEGINALLTGRAAFLLLMPHWGSPPAILASAVAGSIVFSLSTLAIVHRAPVRTALQQFARLHGEDALDGFFLLSLPAGIAVLAQSAAAFVLLGTPFPHPPLQALAWGTLQFLILLPLYASYHRAAPCVAEAETETL